MPDPTVPTRSCEALRHRWVTERRLAERFRRTFTGTFSVLIGKAPKLDEAK